MSRVIKFRYWDEKLKNMKVYPDIYDSRLQPYIMQFTGLLDKKGKEIFEGDVILIQDTYTDKVDVGVGSVPVAQSPDNHLCEVVFRQGAFKFVVNEDADFWNAGEYYLDSEELGGDIEVIGNIYEDSDLIKQ